MCGICGIYEFDERKRVHRDHLVRMATALAHRGPDEEGFHLDGHVGFGHRRLKIIDLETGSQPMSNEDGSVWIVFNGEIYNYLELRGELETKGHRFSTRSDTEVIVHLYEDCGEGCVQRLRGMFAFALWDKPNSTFLLARDRIGKKPIVYLEEKGRLVFASEIKALLQFPEYRREVNWEGINYLFAYEWWIPWPHTAFKGIRKMEPGTCILIRKGKLARRRYWHPSCRTVRRNPRQTVDEFYEILDESVRLRLRSDVPLGALLSGGVDSSSIVAIMRDHTDRVKTFSLGFNDGNRLDPEFLRAREIARMFGTEHHEVLFTPEDLRYLPQMVANHDEPYACITSLFTWFLTRFIKENGVTVVLSGNGPDELLWGYSSGVALKTKALVNAWARKLPPGLFPFLSKILPLSRSGRERVRNLSRDFAEKLAEGIDRQFTRNTAGLLGKKYHRGGGPYGTLAAGYFRDAGKSDVLNAYSHAALMLTYAYGLTVQPDLAGLANAVEIRSPFLDQRVIEFSATLPLDWKVKGFTQMGCKYVLKKTMERKLPRDLLYSRKLTFGTGIRWEEWLLRRHGSKLRDMVMEGFWVKNGLWNVSHVRDVFGQAGPSAAGQALRLVSAEIWHRVYFESLPPDCLDL